MRELLDTVKTILSDTPDRLYILTGGEYGCKRSYLNSLARTYGGNIKEIESIGRLIRSLSKPTLIPSPKTLYISRYDKEFLSSLNADVSKELTELNIPGTLVCLYETDKDESKLDKFLPDYVTRINPMSQEVLKKHLKNEFEDVSEIYHDFILEITSDYYEATLICQSLRILTYTNVINSLTKSDLYSIFIGPTHATDSLFKTAVAARDVNTCMRVVERYEGQKDSLIYCYLSSLLEVYKCLTSKWNVDSYAQMFVKLWDRESVLRAYSNAYTQLKKLRDNSTYSIDVALNYLAMQLAFK